jgi:hypothetical protein
VQWRHKLVNAIRTNKNNDSQAIVPFCSPASSIWSTRVVLWKPSLLPSSGNGVMGKEHWSHINHHGPLFQGQPPAYEGWQVKSCTLLPQHQPAYSCWPWGVELMMVACCDVPTIYFPNDGGTEGHWKYRLLFCIAVTCSVLLWLVVQEYFITFNCHKRFKFVFISFNFGQIRCHILNRLIIVPLQ